MRKIPFFLMLVIATHTISAQDENLGTYIKTFTLSKDRGKNLITWTMKNETGITGFVLERCIKGGGYMVVQQYNTTELKKVGYQVKDSWKPDGVTCYRLIIKGKNGVILDTIYLPADSPIEYFTENTRNPLKNKGFFSSSVIDSSLNRQK